MGKKVHIIHKPKLKHSYIALKNNKELIEVRTPFDSRTVVLDMLRERKEWIKKQLQHKTPSLLTTDTDQLTLFGQTMPITQEKMPQFYKELQEAKDSQKKAVLLERFYKQKAQAYLRERIDFFAQKMALEFCEVRFRKMKSRWGSCSSQKKITLNTQLVKIDKELSDYVLVHELAHLVHMNHSKAFHALVESFLPDAKERRKALQKISLR